MLIKWSTEKRKLSSLIQSRYNPRKATDKQERDLGTSLEKFQLADPIIINKNNHIIGGHLRYRILKKKNGHVPVDVRVPSRQLTDKEERELNIRLNKNSGEFDNTLLSNFSEELLREIGFDGGIRVEIDGKVTGRILKGKRRMDIWNHDKPSKSQDHPTMKPVSLCAEAIQNSSTRGSIVEDSFGGAGAVLIACEKIQRKCRMMEIYPVYCQVIIDRWEKYTGRKSAKCR